MSTDSGTGNVADEIPQSAWYLHQHLRQFPWATRESLEDRSTVFALLGLGLLFIAVASSIPVIATIISETFRTEPSALVMFMIYEILLLPSIVVFGFAIVACLFRGGSLAKNYLVAVAVSLPGPLASLVVAAILQDGFSAREFKSVMTVLFAYYVVAGFVATGYQLWSRWTLVPLNLTDKQITRAGTRALIELTAIAAVLFAIVMSFDTSAVAGSDLMIGVVFFSALGLVSAMATITFLVGFMGGKLQAKAVSLVLLFVVPVIVCSVMARLAVQWTVSLQNAITVAVASSFGFAILVAMMSVCLLWLKACGWRCVR